jgi:hypothetical protein
MLIGQGHQRSLLDWMIQDVSNIKEEILLEFKGKLQRIEFFLPLVSLEMVQELGRQLKF